MDDLADQLERVLGGGPERDQGDIGTLPRRRRAGLPDLDLAGDHLVAEAGDEVGEQLEPVLTFVRNQNAQVCNLLLGYQLALLDGLRGR
ncbi:MAG: hypothetical protein ABSB24_05085 [Gaiellaceae bacterium]